MRDAACKSSKLRAAIFCCAAGAVAAPRAMGCELDEPLSQLVRENQAEVAATVEHAAIDKPFLFRHAD